MKLVVLGGGESGVGAALLGRHLGYEVFLSDKGKLAESYRDELITHRIAFEEGQHSMDRIFAAELVVKSPGIPDTVPMVVALRERGIEVISEIEFAGRHTEAKMVCITGSNGKTTTTLLTCILTCIAVSGYRPSNHLGHHNLYRGQCTDYSEQCYRSAGRANQRCGGHDVYEFHSDQYRRSQHRSLF